MLKNKCYSLSQCCYWLSLQVIHPDNSVVRTIRSSVSFLVIAIIGEHSSWRRSEVDGREATGATSFCKFTKSEKTFLGNLFLSTNCDVIRMTSLALWTQSVNAVFYGLVLFSNSTSAKQHLLVQQADLFKRQRVTFVFQHIFHIQLCIYPNYQQWRF